MKICKICVQPDTRPGIYFDDNGICGACLWQHEKKEIDWNSREKELFGIAEAIKKKENNYDCVIGVSGGKDSTFQALKARDLLGLRCLLVNGEPENITDIGKYNIENLKNLGFDVISIRPNPKIMKKLIRYDFYTHLNPVKVTEYSLWASTYIIANNFNIPLIIQGENAALTLGVSLTGQSKDSDALQANSQNTLSKPWQEYTNVDGVEEKDLYLFHYDRKDLEVKGIRGIWLQYFLKEWSNHKNAEFATKHGLMTKPTDTDPKTLGSYWLHSGLDSDLGPLNQMLKYIKLGFGACVDHASSDIREGRITRDEGIELVRKYDGKCSTEYINKFCKYINITVDEFWRVTNQFRGPMWIKNSDGKWYNTYWDVLKSQ